MKAIMYVIVLLLTLPIGTGCQDDSSPISDETASADSIRAGKAGALLSFFCKVEQDTDGKITYIPNWGTVLYSDNPTVRYVAADELVDAYRWFSYFVGAAEPGRQRGDITEYKIEGHGSIRFTPSTTSDKIATIHVDFVALPEVKEFVFITQDRWPHNDTSPFNFGSVYVEKKSRDRFVCIAGSRTGNGLMVTFDDKMSKRWSYTYPKIYGTPKRDQIETLRHFMYDYFNKKYEVNDVAKDIFEKGESGLGLAPKIYSSNVKFLCEWNGYILNNYAFWHIDACCRIASDYSYVTDEKPYYLPGYSPADLKAFLEKDNVILVGTYTFNYETDTKDFELLYQP